MRRSFTLALAWLILAVGALAPVQAPVEVAPTARTDPDPRAIETAIKHGLRWLAEAQTPYGAWVGDVGHKQGDGYTLLRSASDQAAHDEAHVGVTALAGMAFLASGHLPGRGRHAKTVSATLDYMLDRVARTAYLTDGGTRMYSHAFGTLFLAEILGTSRRRDHEVHEALTRSTRFLVQMQNEYGAWRYAPGTNRADLSVTVCQVQAMRAARNVGIRVPKAAIDRVVRYVEQSRIERGRQRGAFYYKIFGTGAYRKTSYAINAAAVTSLHSAGLYDEGRYGPAVEFIERNYASLSRNYPFHYYYWYGNYYAAQAMRQVGGERWKRFYGTLARDLLARQNADGSWDNSVGPGASFSTAIACLILAIPKGYLPIFHD